MDNEVLSANNILYVKWKDNKNVYFVFTKHSSIDIIGIGKLERKWSEIVKERIKKLKSFNTKKKETGRFYLQN